MNHAQLIARKRDGKSLTAEEIAELVRGYVVGEIPDYQMSALAMAICVRGMTLAETVSLTEQMLASGITLEADGRSRRVDKHSTGGIGDKSSLVLAPLLACCGLQVPMISGRGLGATGGTIDKLESIPGVRTDLTSHEIRDVVNDVGCVITGATADLVPADKKLYALRDMTATVPAIGLITASILSKKLAENLSALTLDVKFGAGAVMKTRHEARRLADFMVQVGSRLGLKTTALVTSMEQPNGRFVGNSVEIDEAMESLAGRGPADLRALVLELGGELLLMVDLASSLSEAKVILGEHLDSGRALQKFVQMVGAQGGNLDKPRRRAPSWTLAARQEGFIGAINGEDLGLAIVEMGGGRRQIGQVIDHSVGLEMLVRLGDRVDRGQPLLNVFASTVARSRGLRHLENSIYITDRPPDQVWIAERLRACRQTDSTVRIDHGLPPQSDEVRLQESIARALDPRDRKELIDAALEIRAQAYCPYSKFQVGASLLADSGRLYVGTNVENASYGLTICAERAALVNALAAGERQFRMLAVASCGGLPPCGACRQFIAEFTPNLPILIVDSEHPDDPREVTLHALLPQQFSLLSSYSNQDASHTGRHETGQCASQHRPQP